MAGSVFDDAVKKLKGNSSLKVKAKDSNNIQTSMMIDKDAKKAFPKNNDGYYASFSAYVNELILEDMKNRRWMK